MNLKELQAFVRLSESLHFSQTAAAIHVSASTLSRMMQRLENEFGQRFFERDNRYVELTPQGKRFEQFAREVIASWHMLRADLDSAAEQLKGRLSIYCTVTAAHLYLAEMLENYRQRHPKVEIILETGDMASAYQKVSDQKVDIAFAVATENLAKKFSFEFVDTVPLKLIAPVGSTHFSNQLSSVPIDLSKIPFIMPESGPAREHTQEWLKRIAVKPKVYAQVAGHEAIVSMVALGCGVAVVPEPVLEHSPVRDKVKTIRIAIQPRPFELGVICLNKRRRDPLISTFINMVVEQKGLKRRF
jgi:LysR family positive regulator for ilvC